MTMRIRLRQIQVADLFNGYSNHEDFGVRGFHGKLDIRPPYQREFIYGPKQEEEVIRSILKGFPLNSMYWVKTGASKFEVLDGQQRTLSICRYINGDFSLDHQYYHNLSESEKNQINSYQLQIYICDGDPADKLDWFRTINIAGEKLKEQELLNAVYAGSWLSSARQTFSKRGCEAYELGKDYVKGNTLRQDFLRTAIDWVSEGKIEAYMATHQHDANDDELWQHYKNVIGWVKRTFIEYRKEMKGIDWGILFSKYGNIVYDAAEIEKQIKELMLDDDVTKKAGIYHYIFSRDPKYLNIRTFTVNQKRQVYTKQNGICPHCNTHFPIEDMEADHIKPWVEGGKTTLDNCQMLCKEANRRKGSK